MRKKVRVTENDLTRIVKKVIKENSNQGKTLGDKLYSVMGEDSSEEIGLIIESVGKLEEDISFFTSDVEDYVTVVDIVTEHLKRDDMGRLGVPKTGKELSKHILNTYVSKAEEELDPDDDWDRFIYYGEVITLASELYVTAEEPNREGDYDYIDKISDELKMYWSPI